MEDSASLGCLVPLDRKWSTDLLSNRSARAGGRCLVEEMAEKQSYLLWGKSWVEQGHQTCQTGRVSTFQGPCGRRNLWGAQKKGLPFRIQGAGSAAEQTIYQDLGDRCLKEKKYLCECVFFKMINIQINVGDPNS